MNYECANIHFHLCNIGFQTVGAVLCAIYVVGLIWGAISKRGKKDDSISKIAKSDSEEATDGNVAKPDIGCD